MRAGEGATAAVDRVAEELSAVRAELARVDGKCATLTGLAGAGLAFLVARLDAATPSWSAVLLVGAAAALAGGALVLLVGVLRPRLGGHGFCRYARLPDQPTADRLAEVIEADRAASLVTLSALTMVKQRRLARAVDLLAVGLVLLAAAPAASAVAGWIGAGS